MATGVVFDESMSDYFCLWDQSYVEKPERFTRVVQRCRELDLISRCVELKPRKASPDDELLLAHDNEIIDLMASTANEKDVDVLKKKSSKFDCVYIHPNSYELARLSAGCAIDLTMAVTEGKLKNGFAIIRPPGHHAMTNEISGYCYFNNIVLAAKKALANGVKKILIVDWDVHHGQGTQRAFYDDPRVLYFSIHRYEYGQWWPELRESDFDYIGEGRGSGFNINVPLNVIGNTNSEYFAAFTHILLPVATEFHPELVLVSAGFDPALGCIEGEQNVTPAFFAHMTHWMGALAKGKVVCLLEGGYCLTSLAESAALTLKALLGDPCPNLLEPIGKPNEEMWKAIQNAKCVLRPFWNCFQVEPDIPNETETKFLGPTGPRPTEFDIMCPTPLRPQEVEDEFERKLQEIIGQTDISCLKKSFCVASVNTDIYNQLYLLDESFSKLEHQDALPEQLEWMEMKGISFRDKKLALSISGCIFQTINEICDKGASSGLAAIGLCDSETILNMVSLYLKDKFNVKKALFLSFEDESFNVGWIRKSDTNNFFIMIGNETKPDMVNGLTLKVDGSDNHIVQALFRAILPNGYQLLPDFITIVLNSATALISPNALSYLLHMLSSLAKGRVLVVIKSSPGPFEDIRFVGKAVQTLAGTKSCMPYFKDPDSYFLSSATNL